MNNNVTAWQARQLVLPLLTSQLVPEAPSSGGGLRAANWLREFSRSCHFRHHHITGALLRHWSLTGFRLKNPHCLVFQGEDQSLY